ncbi:MAG: hypothetical protein QOC66_2431 [Pseudonocardiales bacterium]|nr:hypothetical protein [Pseudonocardiales bacterium]
MRPRNRIIAAVLAAGGLVAIATTSASAVAPSSSYRPPVVEKVMPVVHALSNSDSAVIHVKYHCSGGNVGTHLFLAVKQGPQVDPGEHSSSQFAQTYYSSNYNSDGPGLSLNCDGRSHNVKFVVKPDAYFWNAENAPPLKAGKAFVQVCLFDSTGSEETGFALDYSMKKVVVN